MKRLLFVVVLLVTFPVLARAQCTPTPCAMTISDASRFQWTASADHNGTFGGQPILTSYRIEIFLRTQVNASGVPTGTAVVTVDAGKPALGPANLLVGPSAKPLVVANTEYMAFVMAIGPSGTSGRSAPTVPFGFPAVPAAPPGNPSVTP